MTNRSDLLDDVVLAEAAAWLARLQREDRTAATEAAFKAWVADPAHARAFARATEVWEIVPGAARHAGLRPPDRAARPVGLLLAASLAVAVVGGGGLAWVLRDPAYVTRAGGQETVALEDGTRVTLNTDTRLTVDYSKSERRVRLERGEALFEVAKNPARPFVVQAGAEEVRALGTTFVVRRDAARTAVVLIEGRVSVDRRETARGAGPRPRPVTVLSPGERLTVTAAAGAAVDRPRLEAATAWRRGEVMFDDVSLGEAAAELSRYGETPVVVDDPRLAGLRVSGVFATRDPAEFAQMMAALHGLSVERTGDRILLRR